MKDYDQVYKAIRENHTVNALPRLVAEFNHNRYSNPTAKNTPLPTQDDTDPDLYDITSIIQGRRPGRGIIKARVGQAKVAADYEAQPLAERYYVSRETDLYKYWSSHQPSSGTNFAAGTDIYSTDVNPEVTYSKVAITNKIVIGFENTFSSPALWEIWVKDTVGGNWRQIKTTSTNYTINSEGRVELWWNGTSWTQTKNLAQHTTLAGVQLRIKSMTVANSYFNLIELGLRLEKDLTSYLKKVDDTFDLGDANDLRPIGSASSNVATVSLFNNWDNGFIWNDNNTNTIFRGLMEENVKFTLDYIYKISPSLSVPIRQFTMYSTDYWGAQSQSETDVSLRDSSKFLQETKGSDLFYEDKTVTGIIYRVLDSVGFDNYDIGKMGKQLVNGVWQTIPLDPNLVTIPYFWCSSDTLVWDTLQELAEGTQTALWFDAYDRLQVRTRNQVFSTQQNKVWTLRGNTSGNELVDIADYSSNDNNPSNDVTVNYQTTAFEELVPGIRRNTVVWQPEDETVYVKSSDIQADMSTSSTTVMFTPADAALWPFEGMMRIEAEQIKYKGKEFTYYPSTSNNPSTVTSSSVTVYLESYDDYKKFHFDKTPVKNRYLNKFTGRLKITERGMWNTPVQAHLVETMSGYTQKNVRGSAAYADANGFLKNKRTLAKYKSAYSTARSRYLKKKTKANKKKYQAASASYKSYSALYNKYKNAAVTDGVENASQKGTVQIKSNSSYTADRYLMAVRGTASDVGFKYYGTRLRLNKTSGMSGQTAGLLIQSNGAAAEAGYRIEICKAGGTNGVGRVRLHRVNSAGVSTTIRSVNKIILEDKFYSLDVQVTGSDATSTYRIAVYVDGLQVIDVSVSGSNKLPFYGRFGMYVRGSTNAEFEYLYAIGASGNREWPKNFAKYDRLTKGFASAQFESFVSPKTDITVKRKYKGKLKSVDVKYTHFFFDEFGPIAHEIRKFDVKYDTSGLPVLAPYVYHTNTGYAEVLESKPTSFGNTIYMINSGRDDAALQGTDDGHQFCVYGLALKQRDTQKITSQNKASIAAIGAKELSIESKWIQTKEAAQALADWITAHWSQATDSLGVSVFGNPLIEVGDVVALDIDIADINESSHRYFVTAARNEFSDGGLSTTLTLRRIRN